MTVSNETQRALGRLAAGVKLLSITFDGRPPLTDDVAHNLVNALHDLLVCVLVDFENERRTQCLRCGGRGEVLEQNEPHASDEILPCPRCKPEKYGDDPRH